jgi:hypothetical protein
MGRCWIVLRVVVVVVVGMGMGMGVRVRGVGMRRSSLGLFCGEGEGEGVCDMVWRLRMCREGPREKRVRRIMGIHHRQAGVCWLFLSRIVLFAHGDWLVAW